MSVVLAILSAVLIMLKLFGYITLSWFWVLAPLFIPAVMVFLLVTSLIGLCFLPDLMRRRK